jgi:Protein of unknown function (DUF2541)
MEQMMISRKAIRAVSLVVLLLSLGIAADAQRGRWQVLGSANVDGGRDHDMIRVNAPGAFTALQLGIRGGAIEFQRVVVHFENGGEQELQVRDRIRAGGKTRVIDLNGNRRRIESVEFWYGKPDWRSGRPQVNLWGRR